MLEANTIWYLFTFDVFDNSDTTFDHICMFDFRAVHTMAMDTSYYCKETVHQDI
jgi:hypothetical protein